jgi:DNA-binding sugar fermentation-stimulating protein
VGEVLLELPPPIERRVARRLNRFVVELESGERAYINNTGRLLDLLAPGRQ